MSHFLHWDKYHFWDYISGYIILAFIFICWCVGYFWLFKKTKQIENKKDRFGYALSRGIFFFLLPLILSPCFYCLFCPFFSPRAPINMFFNVLQRNYFLAYIFLSLPYIMLILGIAGWFGIWIWLFKQTKQIEKTKDRFKYASWRALFLLTFPLILPVCVVIFSIFFNMEILGLLLGLFLTLIGFTYWGRPPFVTHQNDKTFKRRLIISVFLTLALFVACYLYLAANATCCSIPSPDGNYNGTFAKDFASDTNK